MTSRGFVWAIIPDSGRFIPDGGATIPTADEIADMRRELDGPAGAGGQRGETTQR
jgi:hypothetical protein